MNTPWWKHWAYLLGSGYHKHCRKREGGPRGTGTYSYTYPSSILTPLAYRKLNFDVYFSLAASRAEVFNFPKEACPWCCRLYKLMLFVSSTYEHTFPSSNLGRAVGNRSQSTSSSTGLLLSTCVVHFCSGVFIAEAMWRWRHGRCARSDVMVTSRAATGTCDSPSRRARNLQTTRERRLFANKAS